MGDEIVDGVARAKADGAAALAEKVDQIGKERSDNAKEAMTRIETSMKDVNDQLRRGLYALIALCFAVIAFLLKLTVFK